MECREMWWSAQVLRQGKAGYWPQTPSLLCIALVLLHTHSWSDFLHLPQHGHTQLFLGSSNLQSPYSGMYWFDLKKQQQQKNKLQILFFNTEKKRAWKFLPSQDSHMWQLVQPVVLRSGHLQMLSSATSWFFPMHSSVCILQAVRRIGFVLTTEVAHTSRDELETKKHYQRQ